MRTASRKISYYHTATLTACSVHGGFYRGARRCCRVKAAVRGQGVVTAKALRGAVTATVPVHRMYPAPVAYTICGMPISPTCTRTRSVLFS